MSGWKRSKTTGDRSLDLGHGLILRVERQGGQEYDVLVFGRELVTPAKTPDEGKRRAEVAARRWLHEALLNLK